VTPDAREGEHDMDAWLEANETTLVVVLAAASAVLALLVIVLVLLWQRSRRAARRAVRERAAAERERLELELQLAEQGSRLTMVRELHEIAVHSVSVIATQAEGARYAASQDPSAAARSAAAIADAARETLADLRRVMTVARGGEVGSDEQPGLSSVRELFRVMRDAGLGVEFAESGTSHELRHGAELAVFRILQEALSNSLEHGGPGTTANVTFTWTDDGLQVLVDDDGTRAAAIRNGLDPYAEAQKQGYTVDDDLAALTQAPNGRGMTEMRERTELFGGVFEAHQVPGVGFTVQAVFPSLRYHNGVHGVPLDRR
jgi:signal transduction histidine kinase